MATLKELAMELAIATLVADVIKERRDILRESLQALLIETGSDSTRATFTDEVGEKRIAKVSLVAGGAKAYVLDEQAFVKMVKQDYPTEVIETVRDTFKTILLSQAAPIENGAAVNTETGAVMDGVAFKSGSQYVTTRFDKDGRMELARAIANGDVIAALPQLMNLNELEAGN
jgi:adenosine/AMP kinase